MEVENALRGFADLHLHQFAHLAFGGEVVWGQPSGPEVDALRSCARAHGSHGRRAWVGNGARMAFGRAGFRALFGHDTRGYPMFSGWPAWNDFAHQVAHENMLRRAVEGGLRFAVVIAVHNELLCRLQHGLRLTMDDAAAVNVQLAAAHAFEASVDAASGGPGAGWYRIVRTPAQAREVVRSGRLAVMLGIEVDTLFGARHPEDLSPDELTAAVELYHRAGVRYVIPLHFRNSLLGGAAFALPLHWSRNDKIISAGNPVPSLPVYRMTTSDRSDQGYRYRGGRCNTQGLTGHGRQLVRELAARGMVLDVDHMSARTRGDAIDAAQRAGCAVIAGHTEFLELSRPELRSERQLRPDEIDRLYRAGGLAVPLLRQATLADSDAADGARGFLGAVRHALSESGSPWTALGSDANGFAGLLRPGTPLRYPFPNLMDGSPVGRSVVGDRAFDLERDGVAHLGMLPDLLAGLSSAGHAGEVDALMTSANGFIDLWDRTTAPSGPP